MSNLLLANPAKRKAARKKAPAKRRAISTKAKTAVRRRRNPAARKNSIVTDVMDAGIGAGGAIAVDLVLAKFGTYIPEDMKSEYMQPVLQGAISLGLGFAVTKLLKNKALGSKLAKGGLTVAMYKMGAPMAKDALGLGGLEYGALDGLEYGALNGMGYAGVAQSYNRVA